MDFSEYRAVLFDLDGVVTPTADVHRTAWRRVFERVLPQLAEGEQQKYRDDDYVLHIDGKPRYDGVAAVLSAHDVQLPWGKPSDAPGTDSICAIGNMKNDAFIEVLARESIEAFPGAIAVLDHLDQLGVPAAIVSSSRNAKHVLGEAGILDRFAAIVDGNVISELGLAGKPDPAPFLTAAEMLEVPAERSIVVEDALSGVKSGAAGDFALVVGVDAGDQAGALRDAGADVVVSDVGELLEITYGTSGS